MLFFRSALVLSTLFLSAISSPTQHSEESQDSPVNFEEFQHLLEEVDDRAIHSVLHSWSTKFQDGVFSKDRSALEHLHSENPPLATHLLHMAKRQTNGTASSLASASTIVVAPSTPTSATPISTKSGAVVFSTSGGGLTTISSAEAVISYTKSSSTILSTFTLPDGSKSTLTSVIVTDMPVTTAAAAPTGSAGASSTGTGNPSLQTGAANPTRDHAKGIAFMLGGAAVVAMAL